MNQIVTAVTHVTDIMGEIASASDEQSRGISQVAQKQFQKWTMLRNRTPFSSEAPAAAAFEQQA